MRLCRDRLRVARESAAPSLGVVPQELLCVPRDVRADKGPPSNVHNKTVEAYSFRGGPAPTEASPGSGSEHWVRLGRAAEFQGAVAADPVLRVADPSGWDQPEWCGIST